MNILYKITYLPHLENNTPPYYYIGSKFNYKGKYFGSPSSNQKDWFTEDLSIAEWWKKEISENKKNFTFEIIEDCGDEITPHFLVEKEKMLHLSLNVKHDIQYFNKSIATTGWVSIPRTDETKKLISEKTKAFWDSEKGRLKKERLSQKDKTLASNIMKKLWENPTDAMLNRNCTGRTKGAKDKGIRRPRNNIRKVYIEGQIFDDAYIAARHFNVHPVNIRRKCRLEKFPDWKYIEE